jgi:hypothetical protein
VKSRASNVVDGGDSPTGKCDVDVDFVGMLLCMMLLCPDVSLGKINSFFTHRCILCREVVLKQRIRYAKVSSLHSSLQPKRGS